MTGPPDMLPIVTPFSGRIVVRLRRDVVERIIASLHANSYAPFASLREVAERLGLHEFAARLDQYANVPSQAAVTDEHLSLVLTLEETAGHSPFPPLHSLIGYFIMDPRRQLGMVEVERLLRDLNTWPEVDAAFRERNLQNAAVTPGDETMYPASGGRHFDGGKVGINANTPAVWGLYDGMGVGFVDLESGWNLDHEDLPKPAPPEFNDNRFSGKDHGTASLGVVVGQDNGKGIVGIAPKATLRKVVSHIKLGELIFLMEKWDIVGAVLDALMPGSLVPGDVLLIEVQTIGYAATTGHPIEIADHWLDAIRLAAGNGIVVIEPAGNGDVLGKGRDLDTWSGDWLGKPTGRTLKRGHPDFVDSGAIVVSACDSAVAPAGAHRRREDANYGSRVDCYAWGDSVYSAGGGSATPGEPNVNLKYTNSFGHTSAASAIIAGAALIVQQMHECTRKWRLAPAQIRALLSDENLGTPVFDVGAQIVDPQIGVMPDLGLIASKLASVPDVYIRDSLADVGDVPHAMVYQSPDIAVRDVKSLDPDGDFGALSAVADKMLSISPVRPNQDNFVYVRLKNRGLVDATGATATVYWSEAGPLVAPVHWRFIGTTAAVDVPGGGAIRVAGPIVWRPAPGDLPASHGCFIAVSDHPLDPAPPLIPTTLPPSSTTSAAWDNFLAYVGRNNNVAWRNFTIVEVTAYVRELEPLLFVVRGAGDEARVFGLEVLAWVPEGTRFRWELPAELARALVEPGGLFADTEAGADGRRILATAGGDTSLGQVRLAPHAAYPCHLRIEMSGDLRSDEYWVALRQIFEGTEVGRLTWAFKPEGEHA